MIIVSLLLLHYYSYFNVSLAHVMFVPGYGKFGEEFVSETRQCFSIPASMRAEAYHQSTTIATVNCA